MQLQTIFEAYLKSNQSNWINGLLVPFLNEYCSKRALSYEIYGPQGNGSRVYVTFTHNIDNTIKVVVFEPDIASRENRGSVLRILKTGLIDKVIAEKLIDSINIKPIVSSGIEMEQDIAMISLFDMAQGE